MPLPFDADDLLERVRDGHEVLLHELIHCLRNLIGDTGQRRSRRGCLRRQVRRGNLRIAAA